MASNEIEKKKAATPGCLCHNPNWWSNWWVICYFRVCYFLGFVQTPSSCKLAHTSLESPMHSYFQIKHCSIRKFSNNRNGGRSSYALQIQHILMLPRQHFLACTTVKMQVRTETWELRYVITSTPPLFSDLLSEEPSNTLYSSFANGLVHRASPLPLEDYST